MLAKFILFDLIFSVILDSEPLILTRYIQLNKLDEAKNLSAVTKLPNASKFESYSGYFTVNEKYNSNLFFWFFPSMKSPEKAPIIVYLEGGPGSSSLVSLFVYGPLRINDHMNISTAPYSWTKEFSIVYIDNPVGTGFSFTNSSDGYSTDQNSVADNLYEFLQQFYTVYHEYRKNDLYIAGQSYAGKYVPALGYKLMQMSNKSNINFKGVAIGNGLIDPLNQMNYSMLFKSLGLIDEKQFYEIRKLEELTKTEVRAKNYLKAKDTFSEIAYKPDGVGLKSTEHRVTELNGKITEKPVKLEIENLKMKGIILPMQYLSSSLETIFPMKNFIQYLNRPDTQDAIHTGRVTYTPYSMKVDEKLGNDFMQSMGQNLTALIGKYKILLFTGNFDIMVGVTSISGYLENPEWKYYPDYYQANRTVWKVNDTDDEVAGYSKTFGNFTHVIVRNAGHCAVCDQPRATLDMIKRFINSNSFDNA